MLISNVATVATMINSTIAATTIDEQLLLKNKHKTAVLIRIDVSISTYIDIDTKNLWGVVKTPNP